MKTIDEILDLATSAADLPSQAIIDAVYGYEDEARYKILELEMKILRMESCRFKLSELF